MSMSRGEQIRKKQIIVYHGGEKFIHRGELWLLSCDKVPEHDEYYYRLINIKTGEVMNSLKTRGRVTTGGRPWISHYMIETEFGEGFVQIGLKHVIIPKKIIRTNEDENV